MSGVPCAVCRQIAARSLDHADTHSAPPTQEYPAYHVNMRSHRSLETWKRAHSLCIKTLRAIDDAYHPRAHAVFDQIRRAAVSVEANIVEGYALGTPSLFKRHLRIARGSAAEVESLLEIAGEMQYLPTNVVTSLTTEADRTLAMIFALMRSPRLKARP